MIPKSEDNRYKIRIEMDGEIMNNSTIPIEQIMHMLLMERYILELKKKRMVEKIIHQQDLIQMENLHLHMDM